MGGIDWRGQTIGLVQQKTGSPLSLPLLALVADKLAGYILDERPASADLIMCSCVVWSLPTPPAERSRFCVQGDG